MSNAHRALVPLLALAALLVQGCGGPDFDTICQEREDCLGGNEKDVEACIASSEGQADALDAIGCTDEYDTYYECITPQLKCRKEPTGIPCTATADCGDPDQGLTCSGGECQFKYYGTDITDESPPCEAESNALDACD